MAGLGRRDLLIGAGAAGAAMLVPSMPARAAVPAGASAFVSVPPQRIADTRNPHLYPFGMLPTGIRVQVTGRSGVPANASAAVLTLTAVNRGSFNYVTAYPAGAAIPTASNLNMQYPFQVAANLVTVRLGAGGAVDLTSFDTVDYIVDLAGVYVPVGGPVSSGRFVALGAATRVVDTRGGVTPGAGAVVPVDLSAIVPSSAQAVVVNLTATDASNAGYFTAYPLGAASAPDASNLNVNGPGETRAAGAVVQLGATGGRRGIQVLTSAGSHILVDVIGYYTGPGAPASEAGLFVAVDPVRLHDSRQAPPSRLWPGWTREVPLPAHIAPLAGAAALNVTAIEARGPGYFAVLPSRNPIVNVSQLNAAFAGQTVPNHVITAVSRAGFLVYSQSGAHIAVDLAGWFTGAPMGTPVDNPANPEPPAAPGPYTMAIPAIGFQRGVYESYNSNAIVDAANVWLWPNTGWAGWNGTKMMTFAHRTSAGGPFRHINNLRAGHDIFLYSSDGRRFQYRVVRSDITGPTPTQITSPAMGTAGHTLSLIACTKPDGTPTSTSYRIVVTAAYVGWIEI
jgi:sortase (surface protein transpeptidase)